MCGVSMRINRSMVWNKGYGDECNVYAYSNIDSTYSSLQVLRVVRELLLGLEMVGHPHSIFPPFSFPIFNFQKI
jgi:hypothetical protein